MAKRVVWSARALADVESIATYISSDSPAYAKIVVKKIVKLTRQLARFPQSGREVPEFQDPSLRELLAYSYRVIYKVEKEEIIIASVIHGKRDQIGERTDCKKNRVTGGDVPYRVIAIEQPSAKPRKKNSADRAGHAAKPNDRADVFLGKHV